MYYMNSQTFEECLIQADKMELNGDPVAQQLREFLMWVTVSDLVPTGYAWGMQNLGPKFDELRRMYGLPGYYDETN